VLDALSPGTTTTYLARCIRQLQIQNLTVITNAVNIANGACRIAWHQFDIDRCILLTDFFALVGPLAEHKHQPDFVSKALLASPV